MRLRQFRILLLFHFSCYIKGYSSVTAETAETRFLYSPEKHELTSSNGPKNSIIIYVQGISGRDQQSLELEWNLLLHNNLHVWSLFKFSVKHVLMGIISSWELNHFKRWLSNKWNFTIKRGNIFMTVKSGENIQTSKGRLKRFRPT